MNKKNNLYLNILKNLKFKINFFNFNIKNLILNYKKIILKKNKAKNEFQSLYLTAFSGLFIILFFYSLPIIVEFKKNTFLSSKDIANNSKSDFQKVLDGESLESKSKIDEGLDIKFLYEDVFKLEDLSNDVIRLNASTIQKLFSETDYNLKNVRKTKLVKPILLSVLPYEMKTINSTKKKKKLFIQIVLPIILEENNRIKLNKKKLFNILNKNHNSNSEKKWLNEKFKQYGVINRDVSTLKMRMDEIPVSLAIAQAAKETGWGASRFALDGNALFGQWTWSGEGIKPAAANNDSKHKVMKFKILKASVRAYQRNLNTHKSYKQFRMARAELRDNDVELDSLILVNYLDKYAQTGKEYVKIIKKIIKQNALKDFDDARLLPSSIQLKSLI